MADTAEILRLMLHAADRLEVEQVPIHNAFAHQRGGEDEAFVGVSSAMAAIALAKTTLRLVAAFMTDPEADDA